MSVYPKGRWYHYDFVYRGRRHYGPTGQDTRRAAEAVERAKRLEAALGVVADAGELTIDEAAGRYLDEKACDSRTETRLRTMVHCIGKATLLREIDAARVAKAIARRRGMGRARAKGSADKSPRLPTPSTVNRDIIDTTLRPLLNRARKVWGAKTLHEIEWKALRLKEPKGIVREYTADEVAAWYAQLPPAYHLALDLVLTYGLRYGELFFTREAVDGIGMRLTVRERKADDSLVIPIRQEHARVLAAMASTRKADEPVLGFTYEKLAGMLRRAARRAGIAGGRHIHNGRHHAATTILRATGNLKLTQRMLGHATIQSTARYAHAADADLRAAIDALPRISPEGVVDVSPKRRRSR